MNGKSTLEVPLELVEEKGYLARCVSIDAVAWWQTLAEAGDALVDAVIETAETLVEDCPTPSKELRKRLSYAQAVYWRRESCNDVKRLLGLRLCRVEERDDVVR